jgi:hypothetical protein
VVLVSIILGGRKHDDDYISTHTDIGSYIRLYT